MRRAAAPPLSPSVALQSSPAMATPSVADRTQHFTESVIREMSRLIAFYHPDDGINLAQGFPDFPAPEEIKEAAIAAIRGDVNQYSVTWGAPALRAAVADKVARTTGLVVDPDREVTVTCGATEAMIATLLATVNPGDEVVIFQPFYENYWPDTVLAGASPRFVTLHEPDWHIDPDELSAAFGERTRAVIINTPNNPTGKVFSRDELELIGRLCERWNALAITDEIYEHLVYEGQHVYLATLPGLRERTVTISGIGKSYSVTGLAGGVCGGAAAPDRCHPQGPRLPDRRSAGSLAGRGGRCARSARLVLPCLSGRLSPATRLPGGLPAGGGVWLPAPGRRLLHHGRHQSVRFCG